ncbi:MAG: flavodoxin family protein [Tissierellia bacterium]|nr:flavodoxin family protein [Tissierellia bacterium]
MNVLAIMGSARNRKNTYTMLNAFLEGMDADDISIFVPSEMNIRGCLACGACAKIGKCAVSDDMERFYEKVPTADCMLLATPIYFNGIPGEAKKLIDRTQVYWSQKYELMKNGPGNKSRPAYLLANGGAPFEFNQFTGARLTADYFFRACNFDFIGQYCISKTDSFEVANRQDVLKELKILGNKWNNKEKYIIQR